MVSDENLTRSSLPNVMIIKVLEKVKSFFLRSVLNNDSISLFHANFSYSCFISGSSRVNGEVETDGAKVREMVTSELALKSEDCR